MAKNVELKEKGTGDIMYPVTLAENILDLNEKYVTKEELENNGGASSLPEGGTAGQVLTKRYDGSLMWGQGPLWEKENGVLYYGNLDGIQSSATGLVYGGRSTGYSGGDPEIAGYGVIALGQDVATSNNHEVSVGRSNKTLKGSDIFGSKDNTLFSIGNGTHDADDPCYPHNAFEVRQSGDIYIPDVYGSGTYRSKPMINLQDKLKELEERFWTGTQEEYNAIETKNPNVFYFIKEEGA